MKATINGVTVEGTPEEVAAFVKACDERRGLRVVPDPPVKLGPRGLTPEEQAEHDRILKMIRDVASRVPNFNITPLAHVCTGGMRYC